MPDPILAIWERALTRHRANNPTTLSRTGSSVLSVRMTHDEIAQIRKLSKDVRATPREMLLAAQLALTEGDPEAAESLLAKLAAKPPTPSEGALDGAGKSKRKPLSPEELAYCEREGITPAEFLARAAAKIKTSRTKKTSFLGDKPRPAKGPETLGTRPRGLTQLERDFCARERISSAEFFERAAKHRKGFRGR